MKKGVTEDRPSFVEIDTIIQIEQKYGCTCVIDCVRQKVSFLCFYVFMCSSLQHYINYKTPNINSSSCLLMIMDSMSSIKEEWCLFFSAAAAAASVPPCSVDCWCSNT